MTFGNNQVQLRKKSGMEMHRFIESMVQREQEHRTQSEDMVYNSFRSRVVNWLIDIGEYFKFHMTTIQLAICLADRVLPDSPFSQEQWQMLTICCMLLASKFNETEEELPPLYQYERIGRISLPNHLVLRFEMWILMDRVGWNLDLVTPAHYLQAYFGLCLLDTDQDRQGDEPIPPSDVAELRENMEETAVSLAYECLASPALKFAFPSSLLAASCMYISRQLAPLQTPWPEEIQELTGYSEAELKSCVEAMKAAIEGLEEDLKEAEKEGYSYRQEGQGGEKEAQEGEKEEEEAVVEVAVLRQEEKKAHSIESKSLHKGVPLVRETPLLTKQQASELSRLMGKDTKFTSYASSLISSLSQIDDLEEEDLEDSAIGVFEY